MNGIWTYTVPSRASGGILVIRDGKVAGGDGTFVCTGTCDVDGGTVRMNLAYEMYNPQGALGNAWGDNATDIDVMFEGAVTGDTVNGNARRLGFDLEFSVSMARHGGAP